MGDLLSERCERGDCDYCHENTCGHPCHVERRQLADLQAGLFADYGIPAVRTSLLVAEVRSAGRLQHTAALDVVLHIAAMGWRPAVVTPLLGDPEPRTDWTEATA
jgi:hypothetical protein